ncbi:MAG: hypothetical protein ACRCUY_11065, partial [Thermoguttaceae bacterium]
MNRAVKQFLYLLTFFASVGTIGVVLTNPQLIERGAAWISGNFNSTAQENAVSETSSNEHLAKFLAQYPFDKQAQLPASDTASVPVSAAPERKPAALLADSVP